MKWNDYYEKFYDWADSTQRARISSLTDFTWPGQICEIAQEYCDEKVAGKLIRKALSQNVKFMPANVVFLSEVVDTETLKLLLSSLKEPLTHTQMTAIEDNSMLFEQDITALLKQRIDFSNMTWAEFEEAVDQQTDANILVAIQQLTDFGSTEEIINIAYEIDYIGGFNPLIQRALDCGVVFSYSERQELIEVGNKTLNKRLMLENPNDFSYEEIDNYKYAMHRSDFNKLKSITKKTWAKEAPPKPPRLGFWTQLGIFFIVNDICDYFFNKNKEND